MKSDDVYLWSQLQVPSLCPQHQGLSTPCDHNLEPVTCDHKEDPAREACVHNPLKFSMESLKELLKDRLLILSILLAIVSTYISFLC